MSKVRIYDLAKELKLDNKKVIEEVRRFGYDVSVPSNSVPPDIAEKVKSKYFPQKAQAVERRVKLVKHRSDEIPTNSSNQAPEVVTPVSQGVVVQPQAQVVKRVVGVIKTETPVLPEISPNSSNSSVVTKLPSTVKPIQKVDTAQPSQLSVQPQTVVSPAQTIVRENREAEETTKQRIIKIETPKIEESVDSTNDVVPLESTKTLLVSEPVKTEIAQDAVLTESQRTIPTSPEKTILPNEKMETVTKSEIKEETPSMEAPKEIPTLVEETKTELLSKEENKPEPVKPESKAPAPTVVKTEIKPIIVDRRNITPLNVPKAKAPEVTTPASNVTNKTNIIPLTATPNPTNNQTVNNRKPGYDQNRSNDHYRNNDQNRSNDQYRNNDQNRGNDQYRNNDQNRGNDQYRNNDQNRGNDQYRNNDQNRSNDQYRNNDQNRGNDQNRNRPQQSGNRPNQNSNPNQQFNRPPFQPNQNRDNRDNNQNRDNRDNRDQNRGRGDFSQNQFNQPRGQFNQPRGQFNQPNQANQTANQGQRPFNKPSQPINRVNAKVETPEFIDAQRTTYIPPPDSRKKSRRPTTTGKPVHNKKEERENREKLPTFQPPPTTNIVAKVVPSIPKELKPIKLVEGTTVKEFAEKLEVKPKDVVALLLSKGVMATINQTLNSEVVREIGKDFGYEVSFVDFEEMTTETEFEQGSDRAEELETRAPVVTVMGHVDHGKTSLLDAIRKTRVAEGEAGGITQHIGAYSVYVNDPDDSSKKRRVVFLDTPGHEAFTMMRARGAKITDVVVLVVAADDGVMPQTIEAIEHAKAAGVQIVVAINKIDKPQAQPDRVKQALSDHGLVWDGWGGDTVMVEVSAKHRINLNGLLEMILLSADILDLKADAKRLGSGVVLEAKLDKGRGSVATVLIQTGSLKVGDPVIAGMFFGRVRAMFDENGKSIQSTGPTTPVEVLGLQGVPSAGDQFQVVNDIAKAQQITMLRQSKKRMLELSRSSAQKLEDLFSAVQAGKLKELLVILKTDVQGSVEVLKDTLQKLSTEKIKVRVIRSGVGAITESDVLLASASNDMAHTAVIIGFNVRPEQRAEEIARTEKVDIRQHSIIYKVEEEIRNAMIGMLEATLKEVSLGKAEIREIIKIPKHGNIAGVMVIEGIVKRTGKVRIIRDGVLIHEGQISSLRRFKDDVSEVKQGFECGIGVEKYPDIKIGDILEVYTTEKVTPTEL